MITAVATTAFQDPAGMVLTMLTLACFAKALLNPTHS